MVWIMNKKKIKNTSRKNIKMLARFMGMVLVSIILVNFGITMFLGLMGIEILRLKSACIVLVLSILIVVASYVMYILNKYLELYSRTYKTNP